MIENINVLMSSCYHLGCFWVSNSCIHIKFNLISEPKIGFLDPAVMCKIDILHQSVLTMILQNPTLVMVRIENKVEASLAEKKN